MARRSGCRSPNAASSACTHSQSHASMKTTLRRAAAGIAIALCPASGASCADPPQASRSPPSRGRVQSSRPPGVYLRVGGHRPRLPWRAILQQARCREVAVGPPRARLCQQRHAQVDCCGHSGGGLGGEVGVRSEGCQQHAAARQEQEEVLPRGFRDESCYVSAMPLRWSQVIKPRHHT